MAFCLGFKELLDTSTDDLFKGLGCHVNDCFYKWYNQLQHLPSIAEVGERLEKCVPEMENLCKLASAIQGHGIPNRYTAGTTFAPVPQALHPSLLPLQVDQE